MKKLLVLMLLVSGCSSFKLSSPLANLNLSSSPKGKGTIEVYIKSNTDGKITFSYQPEEKGE